MPPPETLAHPGIAEALALGVAAIGALSPPTLIAAGGNGLVFRAETERGRPVALKIPRLDQLEPDRIAVARKSLAREGEVLAAIATPHAPRLVHGDPAGRFLVREFVPGRVLEELLGDARLDMAARLGLCRQLLQAAADLFGQFHERPSGGYAIRDFKPRNLVAAEAGAGMVLIDVGSVRSERAMLSNQRRGHRVGSGAWRHWAPEQLLERADRLDRRVDYFALGSTLFAVMLGAPPFANLSAPARLEADYVAEHAAAAERLRAAPFIPEGMRRFVIACLAPDPRQRPTAVPAGAEALA